MPLAFVCFALTPEVKAYNTFYDDIHSTPFQPGGATHETRGDSQTALQFPNASEAPAEIEAVPSAPPTRSSFMATWDNVTGAAGYLLDVSTSSSFSSYVEGYHDLDVGNVTGRVVTGLTPGTTYYYRVRPYDATGPGSYSEATTSTTVATTGLIIHATFDTSITGNPNAAAIEAMINRAISIYETLFSDPITIQIRFRYSTTLPNGDPIPADFIALSNFVSYPIPWNTYINALRADAKTSNDHLANASLPGSALSPNLQPSSAGGRAVGLDTPPAMFANGTVGIGGPYDGIVTLNSATPYQFSRPPSASNFDAQRSTEHEIDEVMGLGSHLNLNPVGTDLRPQDLFSWSSAGVRNISSSGTRFFSINGGVTNLVNFNQNPPADFGDWRSAACPQAHPYVQNAFVCPGQYSDVTTMSPEGINLDVIGYDLASVVVTTNAATNITSSSATLNGIVNPNGRTTTVHFEYGITTNYGSATANRNYTGNTTQSVSANITGLSPNTTYHFRLVGTNYRGISYGNDRTFSTFSPTGPPVVATTAATNVASFSAALNGSLNPSGSTTGVYFQYGPTTSYGFITPIETQTGNTIRPISGSVDGLSASTTYHFRIVAHNNHGTGHGRDRTFTTLTPTGPPVVTTTHATTIASFSAALNGSLDPHGLTTTVYFQYGTTTNYELTTPAQSQTGNTFRNISANISGLSASMVYHFRIVATNSDGTRVGNDGTFTTLSPTGPPVVMTSPATNIASSSATLNGSLDPHGLTTTVHFQYGATSDDLTSSSQTESGNTYRNVGAGINRLFASTLYHFRIVATNSAGTTYGADRTFTTGPAPDQSVAWQQNAQHDGFDPSSPLVTPLTLKWQRDLTANGVNSISYPLIAHGMLFVTVNTGQLMALNEANGSTVWSANLRGTFIFTNAAYDAGKVFAVNSDGLLKAFNATTGNLLWNVRLPGQYLFTSPPTAVAGIVFVGGAGSGGTLYAVNENNGVILWTASVANGDHSSPALIPEHVFVSYACPQTYAFGPTTGQLLWNYSGGCEGGGGKTPSFTEEKSSSAMSFLGLLMALSWTQLPVTGLAHLFATRFRRLSGILASISTTGLFAELT